MEKYELQKLRDLPIEGVAERLGLHVVRHKALCPFHDDHHASLSFRVSKNTFRCSDCWAMLSAGHKAIAIPSATLLSQKDIEQLSIINSQLSISYHMFPDRERRPRRATLPATQRSVALVGASSTASRLQRLQRVLHKRAQRGLTLLCPYSSITACYCAIRMGYLGREKYFKKYLKKSAEIFGNMEFILYLCNVFER